MRIYLGGIESADQAARYYDKYSVIIKGLKVSAFMPNLNVQGKTNFSYSRDDAIYLMSHDSAL